MVERGSNGGYHGAAQWGEVSAFSLWQGEVVRLARLKPGGFRLPAVTQCLVLGQAKAQKSNGIGCDATPPARRQATSVSMAREGDEMRADEPQRNTTRRLRAGDDGRLRRRILKV